MWLISARKEREGSLSSILSICPFRGDFAQVDFHLSTLFDYTLSGSSTVKLGPTSSKLLVESTTATDPQPEGPVDSVNTANSSLTYVVNSTEVADAQPSHHVNSVYTADCDHPHTIDSTPVADLHLPRAVDSSTLANTLQDSPIDSSILANCDSTSTVDSSSLANGGKEFSLREVPHLWVTNPYNPLPFPE